MTPESVQCAEGHALTLTQARRCVQAEGVACARHGRQWRPQKPAMYAGGGDAARSVKKRVPRRTAGLAMSVGLGANRQQIRTLCRTHRPPGKALDLRPYHADVVRTRRERLVPQGAVQAGQLGVAPQGLRQFATLLLFLAALRPTLLVFDCRLAARRHLRSAGSTEPLGDAALSAGHLNLTAAHGGHGHRACTPQVDYLLLVRAVRPPLSA